MSDLRTAIEKALNKQKQEEQMQDNLHVTINEWTKDDTQEPDTKTYGFKPTNNVSRETFNAVRDNQNKTNGELIKIMKDKGFNPSSVGSLLAQMARQDIVQRDDEGRFTTRLKEYTPIKAPSAVKKKKVTITKRPYVKSGKYTTKSGIAALDMHTTLSAPVAVAPASAPAFDPDQLLSTLSFPQVLALYKKIKTLLGEAA